MTENSLCFEHKTNNDGWYQLFLSYENEEWEFDSDTLKEVKLHFDHELYLKTGELKWWIEVKES